MNLIGNVNMEFKRVYVDDIKKTVIAFANTNGGKIYIGIDDDGTVAGVEDIDETMLKCTNTLRDSIKPDVTLFLPALWKTLTGKMLLYWKFKKERHLLIILLQKVFVPKACFCVRAHQPFLQQKRQF